MSGGNKLKLTISNRLQDADLAFVVNMQNKELRDLCGTLKGDRMLAVYVGLGAHVVHCQSLG